MKVGTPGLRALALAIGAVILPCCKTDVGKGDELGEVTVRVSTAADDREVTAPTGTVGSQNCSLSADGRYVAFESTSSQLAPGDSNGLRDIFVKDRLTGDVENITFVISGEFGPWGADNFNPSISGNGRFVAFESTGIYVPPLFFTVKRLIWVYDRATKTFVNATLNLFSSANQNCTNPSLSSDGRFVTWISSATNIQSQEGGGTTYSNPSAGNQVYVTDLSMPAGDIIKLVSHTSASTTTGCNGSCTQPRISADGSVVAFETTGDNLLASGDADTTPDIYVGIVATGALELVSVGVNPGTSLTEKSNGLAMMPSISSDGRYVAFATTATNWGFTGSFSIARRDRTTLSTIEAVSDLGVPTFILISDRIGMSGDGRMFAYLNNTTQIAVRNLTTGVSHAISVNISGQVANRQPFLPTISQDGVWAAWHTLADNLVASDTNGVTDVFVRGPLR